MRKELTVGSAVKIPCHIQPGAFQDEYLVILDTGYGQISGFIKKNHLITDNDKSFLYGRIINSDHESVSVQLPGSFFTTATGQASLSGDWACRNLEPANAA